MQQLKKKTKQISIRKKKNETSVFSQPIVPLDFASALRLLAGAGVALLIDESVDDAVDGAPPLPAAIVGFLKSSTTETKPILDSHVSQLALAQTRERAFFDVAGVGTSFGKVS